MPAAILPERFCWLRRAEPPAVLITAIVPRSRGGRIQALVHHAREASGYDWRGPALASGRVADPAVVSRPGALTATADRPDFEDSMPMFRMTPTRLARVLALAGIVLIAGGCTSMIPGLYPPKAATTQGHDISNL